MKIPQNERDKIHEGMMSAGAGSLPIDAVAFHVAACIVKYNDPDLLDEMPENVSAWIRALIAMYKNEGNAILYFSTGEVDHTEFVRQLIDVLERPGQP
jgi:hypothetical protein